ncbi:MAG: TfoX/Sxy family protein [Planctomycetaceae bacterium]
MAYDPELATRLQRLLSRRDGMSQKAMFGGIGWFLHGHMCVGIWKEALIARVGTEEYPAALREPGVLEFDITGRAMSGWVLVQSEVIEADGDLKGWIERCVQFVRTLPRKTK